MANLQGRYKNPNGHQVIDLVHLKGHKYTATVSDLDEPVVVVYHPDPIPAILPSTRRRPIRSTVSGPGFSQMQGGAYRGGLHFPVKWKVG